MKLPWPEALLALPHQRDIPFSRLSTLGIGGQCAWLFEPTDEAQAATFVQTCHREGIPYKVLGGGSNLVVLGDVHIPVLRLRFPPEVCRRGNTLSVPANFGHIRLSEVAAEAGLGGYEHACGIPGTCGGALAMNAGANGREMVEALLRYRFLTPEGDLIDQAPRPEDFGYRRSHLRHWGIALELTLGLVEGDAQALRATMAQYRAKRAASQPLHARNAGCVFKNPPGRSAGRLIEEAGLKGLRVGQAEVSTLHGNFLLNLGKATPHEFSELVSMVQAKVHEFHGISLDLEVEVWAPGICP